MAAGQSGDTAHLYEGKVIRAAAPSRKKLAGKMKAGGTEVPDDAVPEVHIPTFVESPFGGPLVPKMKFLPADRMVQTLQLIGGGLMMLLAVLTYLVTPADGTFWNGFALWLGFDALGQILHLIIVIAALAAGFFGIFRRDARGLLASYVLFIIISLRFAASKDTLDTGILAEVGEFWTKQLIVLYAVSLVMYMEVTKKTCDMVSAIAHCVTYPPATVVATAIGSKGDQIESTQDGPSTLHAVNLQGLRPDLSYAVRFTATEHEGGSTRAWCNFIPPDDSGRIALTTKRHHQTERNADPTTHVDQTTGELYRSLIPL